MNASTCKTTLKPELGNLALFKIESYTQFAMYIAISIYTQFEEETGLLHDRALSTSSEYLSCAVLIPKTNHEIDR